MLCGPRSSKPILSLFFTWSCAVAESSMPPGSAKALEARRDIDTVSIEIAAFDHYIAEVDAEAKHNAAFLRQIPIGVAE